MSSPRILFANTTNSPRSTPRPPSKFHVNKSHPVCTISLANVTANNRPATRSSTSMVPSTPLTNLVPFPCSSGDYTDAPIIHHPDTSSCIRIHPSSESESSPPEPMTAPPMTSERRKRTTARLLHPLSLHPTQDSPSDTLQQPPRKRPRLQKRVKGKGSKSSVKRTPSIPTSDLRFMASVQRSIAHGVRERRLRRGSPPPTGENTDTFDALDILLVERLRTLLLSSGLKTTDLIDLNGGNHGDDKMNVDLDTSMDIDLEITPGLPRSSPPPASDTIPTPPLPPSQLVASLIIRHHTQRNKPSRSSGSSERNGGVSRGKPRRPSPLAHSIEVESDP